MGIKEDMDKMFNINRFTQINLINIKKVKGGYVAKREYNEYRRYRKNLIEEEWIEKQETFEEREKRLEKIDPFEINGVLENVDKKFCTNIEEFISNYRYKFNTMSFSKRSEIIKIGKDIVLNFILDRSNFIIESNAIYVPNCNDESGMIRWFEENCNNLCLGMPTESIRHAKDRVGYICRFIGGIGHHYYRYCEDNHYHPFLNKYMDNKQRQVYGKFYELVAAHSISIELEDISSNFVRHKHPNTIDMVICYEKDKEIRVPVLELYRKKVRAE